MTGVGGGHYEAALADEISAVFGLQIIVGMIVTACHPMSCVAELNRSEYRLHQVIDLAFKHNPVMNGAEALVEQSEGDAPRVDRQTLLEYAQARADHFIALPRLQRAVGGLP